MGLNGVIDVLRWLWVLMAWGVEVYQQWIRFILKFYHVWCKTWLKNSFLGWSMVWTHAFKSFLFRITPYSSWTATVADYLDIFCEHVTWTPRFSTFVPDWELESLMLFMDILYLGVADRLIWVASSLKEFNVRCTIVNLRKLEKDLFFFSLNRLYDRWNHLKEL